MSSFGVGETVLHYRVVEAIGAGGMGEVYKAEDLHLGRMVALKVLPAVSRRDENARKRLLREARSASALNHPNIVTIYAVEQAGDGDAPLDFIAMEYLEGTSLSALLRRGPMAVPELIDCGIQAADALAAAHQANLIHRDIKPSNIWITARGHTKILDFGLAKEMPQRAVSADAPTETGIAEPLTNDGLVVGTLAYMSPEQGRGEPLDGRADIFSLGCVLYEAAVGRPPFRGADLWSLWREMAEVIPPPPSALRPELPRELDLIVERALAKDKERRYGSATELAEALRRLGGRPGVAPPNAGKEPEADTFVGREGELRRLEERLQGALQGGGRIVFLTGEPGIGKTSLAAEFLRRARRISPGSLIARGACVEQYGTAEAYLPFLDALGSLLAGAGRERVLAVLRTYAPTWCLHLPAAFASSSDMERMRRETIGATKERMLREMGDFLAALTSATPLVFLLEDLHWVDPSSIDLLRHLGQRLSGQRLLLVGTFRPEDLEVARHPLLNTIREMHGHGVCEELALESLGHDHIAAYLDARFAPNDFPPELAELIEAKSEGHALFVSSLAEFLAERGDVANEHGRWRLTRPAAELELEVPKGVRSMIRKKIEALGEPHRRALEYASVEGAEFTSIVLADLLGVDDVALEEDLDKLDKVHRLIRTLGEEELPDGSLAMRYRFVHALYQSGFYENLVPKRRMLLHRQAGEALLRRYTGQVAPIAAQLAHHFEHGRDYARAIEYLIQTGENARELCDHAVAVEHFTHALRLVEKLPESDRARGLMQIYQKRAGAYLGLGRARDVEANYLLALEQARAMNDALSECTLLNALSHTVNYSHSLSQMGAWATAALEIAERIGDQAQVARALAGMASCHMVSGELDKSASMFERAIFLGRAHNDVTALLPAMTYRGVQHFFNTEYKQGEALAREASELAGKVRDNFLNTASGFYLGLILTNEGRFSEALAALNKVLALARQNGNRIALSRIPNGLGYLFREMQDFERSIRYNREGVEVSRQTGTAEAEANALINLVYDYTCVGEADLAAGALRDVEPLVDGDPWNRWRFFGIRLQAATAEFGLARNNLDQTHEHATRLLQNARAHRVPKYIAVAHQLLGEAALVAGERDRAVAELRTAVEALSGHPAPLTVWKLQASLGRALRQAGDEEAAREAFRDGADILKSVAAQISDEGLRTTFLEGPQVRAVMAEA